MINPAMTKLKIWLMFVVFFIISGIIPSPILAREEAGFARNLIVVQERYQANGVFICRPSRLGEKIRDIIVFNNIRSVNDYVCWLQENIEYEKDDGKDEWAIPQETLERKTGDCEDYAFLNAAFLRMAGYDPKVLGIMQFFNQGHAICVFKEGNHYSWIDNEKLIRTKVKTMPELAKIIFDKYKYYCLKEIDLETKTKVTLFKRSDIASR